MVVQYLVPVVLLLAIVSVTVSYIGAKNSDKHEPTTANKKTVASSKKHKAKAGNKSKRTGQVSSQASSQDVLARFQYEVPEQVRGTWYYYDTDGSIQTLTFSEHSVTKTGSDAYTKDLYEEEARHKTRPELHSAIAITGSLQNNVPVVKIIDWSQWSGDGQSFFVIDEMNEMFGYRCLAEETGGTNSQERLYFPSVQDLKERTKKAQDYRSAEDAAGYPVSPDENDEPEDSDENEDNGENDENDEPENNDEANQPEDASETDDEE